MSDELDQIADELLGEGEEIKLPKTAAPKRKAKLETYISADALRRDLEIDPNRLSENFASHAAQFAYYAELARKAEFQYDKLAKQEDLLYAKLDRDVRDQAVADKEKVTEALIKNRITLDESYQKMLLLKNEAKMIAGLAKDAAEAFKQRRDMLIQMGSNAREEMRGELRMSARDSLEHSKEAALETIRKSRTAG